jgi:hypothetical protein
VAPGHHVFHLGDRGVKFFLMDRMDAAFRFASPPAVLVASDRGHIEESAALNDDFKKTRTIIERHIKNNSREE